MKRIGLLIALVAASLCLFVGCSKNLEVETSNITIKKTDYTHTENYIMVDGFLSVKASDDLYKVTYVLEYLDADGNLIHSDEKESYYNGYNKTEEPSFFGIGINESLYNVNDAVNVRINNVQGHYDRTWAYGLGFGLLGGGVLVAVTVCFIKAKRKEKNNQKEV